MNHTPSPTQFSLFDAQQLPTKAALPEGFRFAAREPTATAAESVLSAVQKIESAKSASVGVLERYLALESEAVDTALLGSRFITSGSKTPAFLLPRLLPRALARAHGAGEVWTPELDRISALARLAGHGENAVVQGITKHMRSAVKPALAALRDPAVFTRLVDETGSSWLLTEAMRSAVAAPVWTDKSVQIVGERMPKGLGVLAMNLTLSQEHKQLGPVLATRRPAPEARPRRFLQSPRRHWTEALARVCRECSFTRRELKPPTEGSS